MFVDSVNDKHITISTLLTVTPRHQWLEDVNFEDVKIWKKCTLWMMKYRKWKDNLTFETEHFLKVRLSQSCLNLCNPMDYTDPGILQAKILDWVAFPFSWWSSQTRDPSQVSCITGGFFISWAMRETQEYWRGYPIPSLMGLSNPEIELGFPALQTDSLPAELSGKPKVWLDC